MVFVSLLDSFSNYGYGEKRLFSVLASFSECNGMRQRGSGFG